MRARIFVLGGRDVGRSFEVGESCVLGRGEECDVRLHDRSVSRAHARISCRDGAFVLEDLGSRNGVQLRGERVQRAELVDLDEFLLGELALRFRLESTSAPATERPSPPAPSATSAVLPDEIVLDPDGEESGAPATGAAAPLASTAYVRPPVRPRARGNPFSWDLADLPVWQRGPVVLLALALAAALAWLAFRLVLRLRGSL